MRRDLVAAALVAAGVLSTLPAYGLAFAEPSWRAPAVVAAGLALLVAATLRRLHRGVVTSAVVTVAGLVVALPWLLGLTSRPVLPSPEVLRQLRLLLTETVIQLELTPAPASPTAALVMPVVAGYWAITHVAHELLVRAHRTGLALVMLAVLWASPLVVPMPPREGWPQAVPFLIAAAATLLVTGRWRGQRAEDDGVSAGGLALAVLAVGGAVVAPGLLPGHQATPWLEIGGSQPRGYQPIVDVGDRLRTPQPREVLRVRASQPTYLRLAGLNTFDGFTWRLGTEDEDRYRPDPSSLYTAAGPLPPEAPAEDSEPVYAEVEVLDLANIYVPVPYQPVEVLGAEGEEMVWSTEGGFLATWDADEGGLQADVGRGLTYQVRSARPNPTFERLASIEVDQAARARWTRLPRRYEELRERTRAIYSAAGAATNVERALALQEWFTDPEGGFVYDLDVPPLRGDQALTRFVLEEKVGYCEYFATAMAVMLRSTGIPARVAVGFLPGEEKPAADVEDDPLTEYVVSTTDAHAWVEVLFPGAGWITFDPTPRSDEAQMPPTRADLTPVEPLAERQDETSSTEPGDDEQPQPEVDPTRSADEPAAPSEDAAEEPVAVASPDASEGGSIVPLGAVAGVGGLALVGLVVAVTALTRRRPEAVGAATHPRERVRAAQRRLLVAGARYGIGRRPQETVREVLRRWRREGRVDERAWTFATLTEAAAFGGHVDESSADRAEVLADELRRLLAASVDRRRRLFGPVVLLGLRLETLTRRAVGAGRSRRRDDLRVRSAPRR